MSEYDELKARLRDPDAECRPGAPKVQALCDQAAEAIEALERERDDLLRTRLSAQMAVALKECERERDELRAEVERLRSVIAHAGVELDDARLPYLTLQVDRDEWIRAKKEAERE